MLSFKTKVSENCNKIFKILQYQSICPSSACVPASSLPNNSPCARIWLTRCTFKTAHVHASGERLSYDGHTEVGSYIYTIQRENLVMAFSTHNPSAQRRKGATRVEQADWVELITLFMLVQVTFMALCCKSLIFCPMWKLSLLENTLFVLFICSLHWHHSQIVCTFT